MPNPSPTADSEAHPAAELEAWRAEGWQHLEQGDAKGACQAFQHVIGTALQHARAEGPSAAPPEPVHWAVVGLGRCLATLGSDQAARRDALQALFQAYKAGAGRSGNGLTQEVPFVILQHAGPDERMQLTAWVRRELATARDAALVEDYWRLLLDLEAMDQGALARILEECKAAGYADLVAEKLLDLDRVGEALIVARREIRDAGRLLRFANSPAAREQAPVITALVEERLARAFDPQLADWLAARYAERGDLARALDLRLKLLQAAPGRGDYDAVRSLAQRLGRWEKLQPELRRALQRRRCEEALAELALGEGDVERALEYVRRAPERYGPQMIARLGEAASAEHPQEALGLYLYLVERALGSQEPDAQAEAIGYLLSVRQLYERWGQMQEWQAYLAELEAWAQGSLRAALRRAGLSADPPEPGASRAAGGSEAKRPQERQGG